MSGDPIILWRFPLIPDHSTRITNPNAATPAYHMGWTYLAVLIALSSDECHFFFSGVLFDLVLTTESDNLMGGASPPGMMGALTDRRGGRLALKQAYPERLVREIGREARRRILSGPWQPRSRAFKFSVCHALVFLSWLGVAANRESIDSRFRFSPPSVGRTPSAGHCFNNAVTERTPWPSERRSVARCSMPAVAR